MGFLDWFTFKRTIEDVYADGDMYNEGGITEKEVAHLELIEGMAKDLAILLEDEFQKLTAERIATQLRRLIATIIDRSH